MTTATLSPAVAAPPWNRHGIVAVLAGLFANAILSSATDLALVAAGLFPPLHEFGNPAYFSDSLLFLALLYRTAYGVFGCYLTARLAPRRPMAHSLALAGIGFAIGVAGAIATWGIWQSWYSLAIIAVTLPSGWLGARIAQFRKA
jgi:hypothetical protein